MNWSTWKWIDAIFYQHFYCIDSNGLRTWNIFDDIDVAINAFFEENILHSGCSPDSE
jgi:hypothetical protein